jgi:predicted CXXCH cytochrome family protein
MNSSEDAGGIDALGINAACYVCHMGFVKEQISKTHLSKKITCIDCHGLSASHANDENIGATPPDITFEHDQVDKMCLKCHKRHEISTEELAKYQLHPVCTDCHGGHKLNRPTE